MAKLHQLSIGNCVDIVIAIEVGLVRVASEARMRQSVLKPAFEGRLS